MSNFDEAIRERINNRHLKLHESRESFMRATNDGKINLVPKLPPDQEAAVQQIQRDYMRSCALAEEARRKFEATPQLATDAEIRAAMRTGSEQ